MSKAKTSIPNLPNRNARLEMTITSFRELQRDYEASLTIDNSMQSSTIKAIIDFYYVVNFTLTRRLLEQTRSLENAYTHRQRLIEAKKLSLIK